MYLKGLGDCTPASSWSAFWGAGGDPSKSIQACQQQGGVWIGTAAGWSGSCQIPAKCSAPPAPPASVINVSVPTNTTTSVNTQVSPQISPNLIQQQQPQNSPVSTGTSSNPAQSVAPPQDNSLQTYLAQLAAHQAEQDALIKAQADAAAAYQAPPQQMPSQQPAVQSVPQSTVTYTTDSTPSTTSAAPVAMAPPQNFLIKNAPYEIIGLLILAGIGFAATRNHYDKRGKRTR